MFKCGGCYSCIGKTICFNIVLSIQIKPSVRYLVADYKACKQVRSRAKSTDSKKEDSEFTSLFLWEGRTEQFMIKVRVKKDKEPLSTLEMKSLEGGKWKQKCQNSTASMEGMELPLQASYDLLVELATMLQAGQIDADHLYEKRDELRKQAE